MSDLLKEFLQAWLEWAEGGATEDEPFSRDCGLCTSAFDYGFKFGLDAELLRELKELFRRDSLDPIYPFGEAEYDHATATGEQHLDPNRLAWVRSKLGITA